METILKDVPTIEGLKISPSGDLVYYNNKPLKICNKSCGNGKYRKVVYLNRKHYYIHNLVYLAYVHPIKYKQIVFIDGNCENTFYKNLAPVPYKFDTTGFKSVDEFPETLVNANGTAVVQYGVDIPIRIQRFMVKDRTPRKLTTVQLFNHEGKTCSVLVHKLVALAYLPKIGDNELIYHLDGNTLNNYYRNLSYASEKHKHIQHFPSPKIDSKYHKMIMDDIDSGVKISAIAFEYGVSDTSIHRLKTFYKNKSNVNTVR